jgi:hypothetical protein
MNVVHTNWSHGNEDDLVADIGTWITSSLNCPHRVGIDSNECRRHTGNHEVPIAGEENQMKCGN